MLIIVDCETTGLDPTTDAVVEVAAVKLPGWLMVSSLVAPGRSIPPAALAVHHLRDEDLRGMPKLRAAVTAVVTARLTNSPPDEIEAVAAHNAEFDKGFLGPVLDHVAGRTLPWLCTWRCAQHVWPDAPGYGNQVLRYYLKGVDEKVRRTTNLPPHRALPDAITTACVLEKLLEVHPLSVLLELQGKPVLQRNVSFGKHRGVPWETIDKGFLEWVVSPRRDPPFNSDVVYTARHHLNRMNGGLL